jgi:hypothetical protein
MMNIFTLQKQYNALEADHKKVLEQLKAKETEIEQFKGSTQEAASIKAQNDAKEVEHNKSLAALQSTIETNQKAFEAKEMEYKKEIELFKSVAKAEAVTAQSKAQVNIVSELGVTPEELPKNISPINTTDNSPAGIVAKWQQLEQTDKSAANEYYKKNETVIMREVFRNTNKQLKG